jgi:ATP-dependent DNA ligase
MMRKPRNFDAELKVLGDKARELKTRKVQSSFCMIWRLCRSIRGDLVYAGKVDHGFDKASAADLKRRLTPLVRKTQAFAKRIAHKGIWVEPKLLASATAAPPSNSIGLNGGWRICLPYSIGRGPRLPYYTFSHSPQT